METRHLSDLLTMIENNRPLLDRADEVLQKWESEPLISGLLETPQGPPYHSEGPTVRSHLRLFLASVFAVSEGQVELLEIEEFARLKGYEEEILEMQEMITENPTTFEVFALVHDLGKQFRVTQDPNGQIHFFGHEKDIYRPDVRKLLYKMAEAYRLQDRDVEVIIPLVSQHLVPLHRMKTKAAAKDVDLIAKFATEQGQDADDFIDMLQAAILLDQVFASRPGGVDHLINFFLAEREYAPWKLAEKEATRALERKRAEHQVLVEARLDGHGIMQLTGMKPGKELGVLLKKIEAAVKNEGEMAGIEELWKDELGRRVIEARKKTRLSK